MYRGLMGERPDRAEEPGMAVIDLAVARQRIARMQIERHVEPFDHGPERPKLRQIVVNDFVRSAGLRETVDQRAAKAKLLDAAFELARRAFGVLHRQRRQSLKSIGALGDLFGEIVIGFAGDLGSALLIWNGL